MTGGFAVQKYSQVEPCMTPNINDKEPSVSRLATDFV